MLTRHLLFSSLIAWISSCASPSTTDEAAAAAREKARIEEQRSLSFLSTLRGQDWNAVWEAVRPYVDESFGQPESRLAPEHRFTSGIALLALGVDNYASVLLYDTSCGPEDFSGWERWSTQIAESEPGPIPQLLRADGLARNGKCSEASPILASIRNDPGVDNGVRAQAANMEGVIHAILAHRAAAALREMFVGDEARGSKIGRLVVAGADRAALVSELGRTDQERDRIGELADQLTEFDSANECFDQALELEPTLADVHVNRGIGLLIEGLDARAATAEFDSALAIDSKNSMAINGSANAAALEGQRKEQVRAILLRAPSGMPFIVENLEALEGRESETAGTRGIKSFTLDLSLWVPSRFVMPSIKLGMEFNPQRELRGGVYTNFGDTTTETVRAGVPTRVRTWFVLNYPR